MRHRSNSGVRLDFYQRVIQRTILKHQNPVTGLLPATPNHPHGWVRDNVYSILAVWALALAYKKNADLDEDRAKAYELEQSVVKLMRGLLSSMMLQIDKVERFKYSQNPHDALHAKYGVETGKTVVGDSEWGHLQMDATSLYLLVLAEMTASGLQLVYTLDEVAFIQNLVFYIQCAYRTPDYGIWERGDKTNHGLPELNSSSIGMAKAALDALNELDLFGARGGPASVIHVMPDETTQCQAILQSMLPRESNSKETDAGLLSIIGFPAFAIDDPELIELTRLNIVEKLQGRYGCCRFLRDGYKTPKEDPNRLYYEPWELQVFENIECEWPVFFAYLGLDGIFRGNKDQVEEYMDALEDLMIKRDDGITVMPELYAVPADKVEEEYRDPRSQDRIAMGKIPQMWGQSIYVVAKLLQEGFLSPGEMDPLNRRLAAEPKPDLVVQVVILAENKEIQEKLLAADVKVQTMEEVSPLQVYPARVLSHIFAHLGKSQKLGLTGRPSAVVGILATSKLYTLGDKILAFVPQGVDQTRFYLPLDTSLLIDMIKSDIQFLGGNWSFLGRPLIIIPIGSTFLDFGYGLHPALMATIKKLQTGYISGTRVHLGNVSDFLNTSSITNLTFLTEKEESPDVANLLKFIENMADKKQRTSRLLEPSKQARNRWSRVVRKSSIRGIIKRTWSIQVDPENIPDFGGANSNPISPSSSSEVHPLSGVDSVGGSNHPHLKLYKAFVRRSTDLEPRLVKTRMRSSNLTLDGNKAESTIMFSHDNVDHQYDGIDCRELIQQLKETDTLHEQADIIHYLYVTKGPDWDTEMEGRPGCRTKDLLVELYDKAGLMKQWWLVRHTAGMLRKKVEDLAKAVTDILVRQKQLAVGLPPEPREKIITRPLPPDELAAIIHEACGDDSSTAMLTQEILVYLAMFIRTEPKLFAEMLRIRVGLIIQVMATELARTLKVSGEEASDQLFNLSPYEMKTLLHHILSGKEFGVTAECCHYTEEIRLTIYTAKKDTGRGRSTRSTRTVSSRSINSLNLSMGYGCGDRKTVDELSQLSLDPKAGNVDNFDTDRQGQWLRRRRLDGALNRVPVGFYTEIWKLLKRCHGITIENYTLLQSLTREMTPGEMKFALEVEKVLNLIPQPEYRQLMVEAMMVLCMVVEHDNGKTHWNQTIGIERIVVTAHESFIQEQLHLGDETMTDPQKGSAGLSVDFYDTAPSGRYGTMSYMCKAVAQLLQFPQTEDGNLDCAVS